MTSKERVMAAIRHEEADRAPLNVWLYRQDYQDIIAPKYGDVDGFYDAFGIDMVTVFVPVPWNLIERRIYTLDEALEVELTDPQDDAMFEPVRAFVEKYGKQKQMAVFCQTGGVFETSNGFMGIENNLANLALEPEKTYAFYEKIAKWFAKQIDKIIDCGVDVVHMSDDWGENNRMMFSPKTWRDIILPNDKIMVDAAKKRGVPVSLHSCGYVMDVLEGCVELGLDVLNPIQKSAGMDANEVKRRVGDKITLYGGLDVRYLPEYTHEELEAEVKGLMDGLKKDGGFIFCTAHTVAPDVPLSNLEKAYEFALKYGKY